MAWDEIREDGGPERAPHRMPAGVGERSGAGDDRNNRVILQRRPGPLPEILGGRGDEFGIGAGGVQEGDVTGKLASVNPLPRTVPNAAGVKVTSERARAISAAVRDCWRARTARISALLFRGAGSRRRGEESLGVDRIRREVMKERGFRESGPGDEQEKGEEEASLIHGRGYRGGWKSKSEKRLLDCRAF